MSDLAGWNLHGPVESLRTEFAEWDLNRDDWQPPRSSSLAHFLPEGRMVSIEHHNPDGRISTSRFSYDGEGRLVDAQHQIDGVSSGRTTHAYDEDGRLTRVAEADRVSETWSYGPDGSKTKTYFVPKLAPDMGFSYTIEGTDQGYGAGRAVSIVTSYGAAGPEEVVFYDADLRILHRVTFQRDAAGRLLLEQMQLGETPLFPEAGDAAAAMAKLLAPDNFLSSTIYAYDEAGRLIERRRQMGPIADHRTTWRYDGHDNRIEETAEETSREMQIDEEGNCNPVNERSHRRHLRYDYRYDEQGNWTERVVWLRLEPNPEFQPSNVERRQIAYYDR
jgi:YD repeat-containing protein